MQLDRTTRRRRRSLVALGGAAALALTQGGLASAQDHTEPRGIDNACHANAQQADRFADVSATDTHAEAINCLWVYNVVEGRLVDGGTPVYAQGESVTRQQMASFVAQGLDLILDRWHQLPDAEPDDAEDRFADGEQISAAHAVNVVRLHDAGIVAGYDDFTYRPGQDINRAQMAAFLARSIEDVTGEDLPRTQSFDDVEGTQHQADIEKVASIGVTAGTGDGDFSPAQPTTRGQMATFVARSLDYLAAEGYLVPADYAPDSDGSAFYIHGADTAEHEDFDRAAFRIEGSGEPGWNARYIDEAVAQGSGQTEEIAGDAIIEIWVTGATYPEDADDAWVNETITVEGDGIVEVVSGPLYEGEHQIWVGTTDVNDFSLDRTDDGDVYIDVSHG